MIRVVQGRIGTWHAYFFLCLFHKKKPAGSYELIMMKLLFVPDPTLRKPRIMQ